MGISRYRIIFLSLTILLWSSPGFAENSPWAWGPEPTDKETQELTRSLRAAKPEEIEKYEKQIWGYLRGHQVPWNVWEEWFPALYHAKRFQTIADMSLSGINSRPALNSISGLMEWRVRALLALNKPQDALIAAKSYYNACNWNETQYAVQMVAICLAQANPSDAQIGKRFEHEQAQSASIGATSQPSEARQSVLKAIRVDVNLYDDGVVEWVLHGDKFYDRLMYGTILLAADQGEQAERVYRDCYNAASTQEELNWAAEGVARSLRAQDGSLIRANAWLVAHANAVQKATAK
jgi:hypothetical protein